MMRCASLESQRNFRDLAQLPRLIDEVMWLGMEDLACTSEPVILCGIWLSECAEAAAGFLHARSHKGLSTIVVPRFKAGDLSAILGAPSGIEVHAADFDTVDWEDGRQYAVSGVCYLKTSLHAGRWAVATGLGPVVLSYRPHSAAGQIVLCTASITGRPPGVDRKEQYRLLERILRDVQSSQSSAGQMDSSPRRQVSLLDLVTFLQETGERGASLLLTLFACNGDREADISEVAARVLGLVLSTREVEAGLKRLQEASPEELSAALRKYGWGAHLRRIEQLLREGNAI